MYLITKNIYVMELRQAQRKQAKIKLALQGASGTGKTYSALLLVGDKTD
jgi:Rad3-related DNA helicase